jgi:hypothetical protein
MASGVSSGWGPTPRQIAGIDNYATYYNNKKMVPLTYEQSINSYNPTFDNNGTYISPLTLANRGFYNKFGQRKSRFGAEHDDICIRFNENKCVNPISGAPIKKNGPTYNQLVKRCSNTQTENIFVGRRPNYPESYAGSSTGSLAGSRRPSSVSSVSSVRSVSQGGYDYLRKYINVNGRVFNIGSNAKISPDEYGKIIKMGPKQIILIKSNSKERRLSPQDFATLNA